MVTCVESGRDRLTTKVTSQLTQELRPNLQKPSFARPVLRYSTQAVDGVRSVEYREIKPTRCVRPEGAEDLGVGGACRCDSAH